MNEKLANYLSQGDHQNLRAISLLPTRLIGSLIESLIL